MPRSPRPAARGEAETTSRVCPRRPGPAVPLTHPHPAHGASARPGSALDVPGPSVVSVLLRASLPQTARTLEVPVIVRNPCGVLDGWRTVSTRIAWSHDRARGADQAVRRQDRRRPSHLQRAARHRHRLPRPERRGQVHDDADDARSGQPHQRRRSGSTASTTGSSGPAEVHRGAAGGQGDARRAHAPTTTCCAWPRATASRTSGSTRCWTLVGLTTVAKKTPKGFSLGMGQRLGIAAALLGDPRDPDVRRAGQRPRPRGHPLDPQSDEAPRARGPYGLRLLPSDERNGADRRALGRHRAAASCSRTPRWPDFIAKNSRTYVRVRTPQPERLRDVLHHAGVMPVVSRSDGALEVDGVDAEPHRRAGRPAQGRAARTEPAAGLAGGGVHAADGGVGGVPRAHEQGAAVQRAAAKPVSRRRR